MADAEVAVYNASGVFQLDLRSAYDPQYGGYGYAVTEPEQLIDAGTVAWRRHLVSSPFVHGEYEAHAVLGMSQGMMTILVLDQTHGGIQTKIDDLIDKVGMPASWRLRLELDGTAYQWDCMRSDYHVVFNRRFWHAKSALVRLSFPRRPLPLDGPV